jgi:hypothetical protein
MAITARLSRRLYEAFGDEAAADMVDWMHQVDAHRAELRELNDLNFSRLEGRLAQTEARFEARVAGLEATVEARFAQWEATIVGRLEAKIEQRTADLMKWSFVFWVSAVGGIAALAGVLR